VKKSLTSFGVAATFVVFFGSGTAGAINEYKGMTYEKASAAISKWGTPVVASRVGSFLPTEKCLITGSRTASFLDSSGNNRGGTVLLDLNCNDNTAAGEHPGYSVMTPQGAKAAQQRRSAESINKNFTATTAAGKDPWCAEHLDYCQRVCKASELCTDGLLKYLGL
jgi:hypothetical protein